MCFHARRQRRSGHVAGRGKAEGSARFAKGPGMRRFHYPNLASAALVARGPAGSVSAGLVMCRTASRPRSCRKPSKVTFVGAALCFFLRGRVRTTTWRFNSEQGAHGKNNCWDQMLSHWVSCWFASNSMVASNARPSWFAVQIPCGLVSSPLLLLPLAARPVLLHIPKSQANLGREHFWAVGQRH
jgi:hypothetical protein